MCRALKCLLLLSFFCLPIVHAESIKIGATLALSGDGAEWGKNAQRGIQLATEIVNAEGGIQGTALEVIFEDYRSSEFKLAANAAQKFTSVDNVKAILTQWSGDSEVVWPIATRAKIITLCIGPASDDLTRKSPYIFRVWPSDESLVVAIVDYALKNNLKRGLVIGAVDPYFSGLTTLTKKHWRKNTGQDVPVLEIVQREQDFAGVALRAKQSRPDVIFIHTSYDAEGVLLKRLRELGVNSVIIGTQRSDDPAVTTVAGPSAEGLVYPQYSDPESKFRAEFKLKYNDEPGAPAEYAYDAVMVIARSMRESERLTGDAMREALLSVRNFSGASGIITLDETGNRVGKPVEMKIIKGGKGVALGPTLQTNPPDFAPSYDRG